MQGRDIAVAVAATVLIILLLGLLGGGMMMGPGMHAPFWDGTSGFSSWWWILMPLFWALVIGGGVLLLVWLIRQSGRPDAGAGVGRPGALDILRERYARGEITREQYEQIRRDLEER